jgi:hypothetical protein
MLHPSRIGMLALLNGGRLHPAPEQVGNTVSLGHPTMRDFSLRSDARTSFGTTRRNARR